VSKKAKKKTAKKKGRPAVYQPKYVKIAGELCREKGYTDKNLADHFKVCEGTINRWKNEFPNFYESLKKGKDDFDSRVVEQSLLKRAVGYSYVETTRELQADESEEAFESAYFPGTPSLIHKEEKESSTQTLAVTKKVTKHMAPDVTAQIFWLKNRKPQRWSDMKEIEHRIEDITKPLTLEEMKRRICEAEAAGDGIDKRSINGGNGTS